MNKIHFSELIVNIFNDASKLHIFKNFHMCYAVAIYIAELEE